MITIACVYWQRPDSEPYCPDWWILRLKRMVEDNVTVPHRFVCLSNVSVPCERIELTDGLEGWWNKVELFRSDQFEGRVFYLDLDTIIFENIDELLEREEGFIALRSFHEERKDWPSYFNSSLMSWDADGSMDYMYEEYNPTEYLPSQWDQEFYYDIVRKHNQSVYYWQELVDGIYSYKKNIRKGLVTVSPRIVCFHGTPRPWDVKVYEKYLRDVK